MTPGAIEYRSCPASMGITVDALKSLLARARRNLRAQLAGSGFSKDMP